MSGLYIHIPFCERKCIYCDFYSVDKKSSIDRFLEALETEIASTASIAGENKFGTIFIGGGTPSLLTPAQLEKIFHVLSKSFMIENDSEITIEANPGTVTTEKLRDYRALGINRISFGIQSFHKDELQFLGRIHNVEQAMESIGFAREAGFTNIGIDIMISLPGQTVRKLEYSLARAVALEPRHISTYSLIIEKGTPLYRMVEEGKVTPLSTDLDADLYEFTMEYLTNHGFEHYEVSNYARPGFRSIHNSNYWNHTPYIGFGPSAHSFWEGKRWWNIADVEIYCDLLLKGKSAIAGNEILGREQLLEEAIFLGLRSGGINLQHLVDQYGFFMAEPVHSLFNQWINEGLAVQKGAHLRLTSRGYLVCDELCARLIDLIPASQNIANKRFMTYI
ncbi:MAG: radical SAM family heme chaperone HemW [Bacteroidota bacterium]